MRSLDAMIQADRTVEPDLDMEDRVWAALEPRIAAVPAKPGPEVARPDLGGVTPGKALLGIAAVVTAVALAVGASDRPIAEEPLRLMLAEVPAPLPAPSRVLPEAAETIDAPPRPEERRSRAEARPRRVAAARVDVETSEFQLIEEIRGAVERGEMHAAMRGISEHAQRFGAAGQFEQERVGFEVDALCGLRRVEDADRIAGEFLRRWPDSPYAQRIRRVCEPR